MRYSLSEAVQHVYREALERSFKPDSDTSQPTLDTLIGCLEALWPQACQEFREAIAYRCAREYRIRN